jgi:hypothetical protein
VRLEVVSGRLLASAPAATAGLIERRGEGLTPEPSEPSTVLRLVVDIAPRGETPPRWPEDADRVVDIMGVPLARLTVDLAPGPQEGAYAALRGLDRVTW